MADDLRARNEGSAPTDHLRVYAVPGVADLTARGLAECTCGVRYPAAGGTCPDAANPQYDTKAGSANV